MAKTDTMDVEAEDPLDAFLMEAPAAPVAPHQPSSAPLRHTAPHVTATTKSALRSVAEISALTDGRFFNHVSKEAADTRRRIAELRRAIDETAVTHITEMRRLTRIVTFAIVGLIVLGLAQLGFAIWLTLG